MASAKNKKKLVIGWFTFTCSEDSSIVLLELMNDRFFEWKELLEFKHCKVLKTKNEWGEMDVAFVEGAISTDKEARTAAKIRSLAKKVVAIGSCAVTGMPSAQRNQFGPGLKKEIEPFIEKYGIWGTVKSLKEVIPVDAEVPGCPMTEKGFFIILDKYLKEFGVK